MRTTLKIVLPLIISVVVVSLLFAVYQVRTEKKMLRNDLSRRAEILAESLQENVEPLFDRPLPDKSLQRIVDRFGQREHLKGIAVYNANGATLAVTPGLPQMFQTRPPTATRAALRDAGLGEFLPIGDTQMQLYAMPLHRNGQAVGTLVLAHDASYIDSQVSNTLRSSLLTALVQTLFISGLALILVRWTLTAPRIVHGSKRSTESATVSAARRAFRSDSSRGYAPGARFERSARDRRRGSPAARIERVALDRRAIAREPQQQAPEQAALRCVE